MVKALEKLGVALIDATDVGAPVGAAVIKCSHPTIAAAHPEKGLTRHGPALEVAGVGKLRFVTKIEPAALENVRLLQCRNLSRVKYGAVHAEHSPELVLVNQFLWIHFLPRSAARRESSIRIRITHNPYSRFGLSPKIFCANDWLILPPRASVWIASMSLA